jgi:hypothetical protein
VDALRQRRSWRRAPRVHRPLRRRVVHGHLALVVREGRQVGQLLDLRLEVHVDHLHVRVERHRVAAPARAAAAVLEVEARQVLEHLVQRLLLVLVRLAEPQDLVCAELADLVSLEYVVLAHPVQLAGRVLPDAFYLCENISSDSVCGFG